MLVLVEAVSMFRMRYVVEVPEGKKEWALDTVTLQEAKEFSQDHLDEIITSHRVVTEEEAIKIFKEDHPYLNDISNERVKEIGFTTMAYIEQLEKEKRENING